MKVAVSMERYIELTVGQVNYTGPSSLVQFKVHNPQMVLKSGHFLVVQISFQRMFLYHLVSTFLPSLCLLVVSLITMYIDESHFEATIMVSLTSMLVMYTLFQSHTDSLPQTAYIKMIDIWFLHGLVVPFFVFILEVATELAYAKQKRLERKTKNAKIKLRTKKNEEDSTRLFGDLFPENDASVSQNLISKSRHDRGTQLDTLRPNNGKVFEELHIQRKMVHDDGRKTFWWAQCCRVLIPSFSILFTTGYGILAIYYYME